MPEDCVDEWIRPDARPEDLMKAALTEMVYEVVADEPAKTDIRINGL